MDTTTAKFNPKLFGQGFRSWADGFSFLAKHRELWKYTLIPAVLNAAVFAGFVFGVYWAVTAGFNATLAWIGLDRSMDSAFVNALLYLARIVVAGALALVGYHVLLIVYGIVSGIVCGPFNAILAHRVYQVETGKTVPGPAGSEFVQFFKDLGFEVAYLVNALAVSLLLLLWNLVPGVGSVIYVVRGHYFTWTILGWDHAGRMVGRQGHGFGAQKAWAYAERPAIAGLGAAVWLLLFVPGLNLLVMPGAVAGGALLYAELEKKAGSELAPFYPNRGGA